MSVKKSHTTGDGRTSTNAYHQVTKVDVDQSNKVARVDISIFNSYTQRGDGSARIARFILVANDTVDGDQNFTDYFDLSALDTVNQNPIERAYVFMKSGKAQASVQCDYSTGTTDIASDGTVGT